MLPFDGFYYFVVGRVPSSLYFPAGIGITFEKSFFVLVGTDFYGQDLYCNLTFSDDCDIHFDVIDSARQS